MKLSEFIYAEMRAAGANDTLAYRAVLLAGASRSHSLKSLFGSMAFKRLNLETASRFIKARRGLASEVTPQTPAEFAEQLKPRARARHLEEMQSVAWANGMFGVALDVRGLDFTEVRKLKEGLEAMGYDTAMVFVNSPAPDQGDATEWSTDQQGLVQYRSLFGHDLLKVDSLRTEANEEDRVTAAVRQKVQAWYTRPLANPFGRAVLQALRSVGGKNLADLNRALQKTS